MSIDICGVFQKKVGDTWEDAPAVFEMAQDRYLFSWLMPGFARIPSVAPKRGLPSDFLLIDSWYHPLSTVEAVPHWKRTGAVDAWDMGCEMGEWGHSWVLASEILNAPAPRMDLSFEVPIEEYRAWDGESAPNSWLGRLECHEPLSEALQRSRACSAPDAIGADTKRVLIDFDFTDHFREFVELIARLHARHGEIRLVFGFT